MKLYFWEFGYAFGRVNANNEVEAYEMVKKQFNNSHLISNKEIKLKEVKND